MLEEKNSYRKYIGIAGDILIPFFFYFLVYVLALIGLTSLVITILQNAGDTWQGILLEQEATVNAVIGGFAMLIGAVPLIPAFRQSLYQQKAHQGKRQKGVIKALITIALAFTASIAVNILFILLHVTENSEAYTQTAKHQYSVIFPVGLFLYGLVSPLAEEVIFRGIIYNRMKKYMTVTVSMLISALLFGIYHGNLVQAFYGFCMGILIAYTYEKFDSFFYAFLFHAAANVSVYTITGSPRLYEMIIRPYVGLVFGGITVVLLAFIQAGEWHSYKNDKLYCEDRKR